MTKEDINKKNCGYYKRHIGVSKEEITPESTFKSLSADSSTALSIC